MSALSQLTVDQPAVEGVALEENRVRGGLTASAVPPSVPSHRRHTPVTDTSTAGLTQRLHLHLRAALCSHQGAHACAHPPGILSSVLCPSGPFVSNVLTRPRCPEPTVRPQQSDSGEFMPTPCTFVEVVRSVQAGGMG